MRVLGVVQELERYSPFCEVRARGQILEVRDSPGDLAILGIIDLGHPTNSSGYQKLPGAVREIAEKTHGLAPPTSICPGGAEIAVHKPCLTHELPGVVAMDYAKAEARVAAMRPLPIMPDCPVESCPTHEPVDYRDINEQLRGALTRALEKLDDHGEGCGCFKCDVVREGRTALSHSCMAHKPCAFDSPTYLPTASQMGSKLAELFSNLEIPDPDQDEDDS